MPQKESSVCDGVQWTDVSQPSQKEMEELARQYGLNQYVIRDCLEPDHLPKYDLVGDINFLILRFFNHDFDKRIAAIQDLTDKIAVFYTNDFLPTVHKGEIHFMDNIRRKYVETEKCTTSIHVVAKIFWHALESFMDPVQRLSERIDFYENRIMLRGVNYEQIEGLYYIKQQASMCNKVLMLMLEPINHLRPGPEDDGSLQDVRDQHLKIQTLYSQTLEEINNLTNLYMSISAKKTNDVMRVLTVFSVFFMPLTFLAGIYGMNFEHMPELSKKWGYPAVLLAMAVVTVVIYFWFKRKKWL